MAFYEVTVRRDLKTKKPPGGQGGFKRVRVRFCERHENNITELCDVFGAGLGACFFQGFDGF
jgi:hypothetical protein